MKNKPTIRENMQYYSSEATPESVQYGVLPQLRPDYSGALQYDVLPPETTVQYDKLPGDLSAAQYQMQLNDITHRKMAAAKAVSKSEEQSPLISPDDLRWKLFTKRGAIAWSVVAAIVLLMWSGLTMYTLFSPASAVKDQLRYVLIVVSILVPVVAITLAVLNISDYSHLKKRLKKEE